MPQQSLVITGEPVFRALADPTRRAIFDRLVRQSMSVKVIAADMLVSQPAVSQHLKVLKEANLVAEQRKVRIPASVTGHSGHRDRFAHGHRAGVGFVL